MGIYEKRRLSSINANFRASTKTHIQQKSTYTRNLNIKHKIIIIIIIIIQWVFMKNAGLTA